MSFYTSTIYDGVFLTGYMIAGVATSGTTIYCSHNSNGGYRIVKIDADGTVTPFVLDYEMRCITIANGYLFVLDYTNALLHSYLISSLSGTPIHTSSSTLTHPQGICTDWNGFSSSFNLFVAHESGEPRVAYYNFNGTTLSSMTTFSTHTSFTYETNERRHIVYRKYGEYKYLYITTENYFIIQVDITMIGSPVSTIIDPDGGMNLSQSWGIVCDPLSNSFYIADFNGIAVYKYTYVPNTTTGSITSFNSTPTIIITVTNTGTSITNGASSTSGYVMPLQMSYNITSHGVNLFISTQDGYVIKLYPIGGTGIGGDPHIKPIFGDLYTLDNSIKYVKLFENYVGSSKIVITGETWMLPELELEKFKHKKEIYKTMTQYTYLKTIYIYCDDFATEIDADTLEYTNENTSIKFGQIQMLKQIFSVRRQEHINNKKGNTLQRMASICGKDMTVHLILSSNVESSDRNSIRINIEGNYDFNKENFSGALVYEGDNEIKN